MSGDTWTWREVAQQLRLRETWLPLDAGRSAWSNGILGAIIAVTAGVDLVVNPRAVTANAAFRWGAVFGLLFSVVLLWRARELGRGRGAPALAAPADVLAVVLVSVVVLQVGVLPPLLLLYLPIIVSFTFTFVRLARTALTVFTLAAASGVSIATEPGIGNTVLFIGFLGAFALVAELRMEDVEQVAVERELALKGSERRADLVVATANLRTLDVAELHRMLAEALVELGFDHGQVMERLPDGGHAVRASTDPAVEAFPPAAPGSGLAGRVLATNRTVVVDDYDRWDDRIPGREGISAVVAVPIRCFGAPVAVLAGTRQEAGLIAGEDIVVVEAIALHAGAAMENARTYERERQLLAQLVELDGMRDDLLSNVSHELRTPLQAIAGMGETLRTRRHDLSREQTRILVDRINANADRLKDRIESLLSYSRLESGHQQVAHTTFDLVPFVRDVADRIAPVMAGRVVDVVGVSGPVHVRADERLIEQVLENLLTNAVKYAPDGPVTIEVRAHTDSATIMVHDRGEGLPSDDLERVTERFYRGGHPNLRPQSGLGLGLALAKAIVNAHDRDLVVQNSPGGASVGFDLPLAEPATVVPGRSA